MREIFDGQDGVATRRQVRARGVSDAVIRRRLRDGHWQALATGVYALFSGPVPGRAAVWAAVLRCGDGAAAGPRTSLWLAGAIDRMPSRLDVVVGVDRNVGGPERFRVYRRVHIESAVLWGLAPPRMRVEEAVLDVCAECARAVDVVDLLVTVVQRRLTTAGRIAERLARRRGHRWRGLIQEVLDDVTTGVASPLERRWRQDVERRHGLPRGLANRADDDGASRVYRDVEYVEYALLVELDGEEAHPREGAFRDRRRDNRGTVSGRRTLRYGWREVAGSPCEVAAEVAAVLHLAGWPGQARRCGAGCAVEA